MIIVLREAGYNRSFSLGKKKDCLTPRDLRAVFFLLTSRIVWIQTKVFIYFIIEVWSLIQPLETLSIKLIGTNWTKYLNIYTTPVVHS